MYGKVLPDNVFRQAKNQWGLLYEDAEMFFVEFLAACDLPGITAETPMSEIEHDTVAVRAVRRASFVAAEEIRQYRLAESKR